MSGKAVQVKIDSHIKNFAELIANEQWTLSHAHKVLHNPHGALDLFEIAALAKVIACFQCSADLVN